MSGLFALLIFLILCVCGLVLGIGLSLIMCPHVPEETVVEAANKYTAERRKEDVLFNTPHPSR